MAAEARSAAGEGFPAGDAHLGVRLAGSLFELVTASWSIVQPNSTLACLRIRQASRLIGCAACMDGQGNLRALTAPRPSTWCSSWPAPGRPFRNSDENGQEEAQMRPTRLLVTSPDGAVLIATVQSTSP